MGWWTGGSERARNGGSAPEGDRISHAKIPREEQQEAYFRQMEIDPTKYTPEDVKRALITEMPPIKINVEELMACAWPCW